MSGSNTSPGKAAAVSAVNGIGQVVVNTSDLNRFRTFYEGVLGLPHVISLSLAPGGVLDRRRGGATQWDRSRRLPGRPGRVRGGSRAARCGRCVHW